MSAELSSHTSPIAPTATYCSCSLWFFVLLFPHDENCAFIFATPALVRLFSSCVSLVCVVRECVAFCCVAPRMRSDIMRGLSLSMRVPTVSPANDENFCRELSLTEWWEKSPKGKEGAHLIYSSRRSTLADEEQKRTCLHNSLSYQAS